MRRKLLGIDAGLYSARSLQACGPALHSGQPVLRSPVQLRRRDSQYANLQGWNSNRWQVPSYYAVCAKERLFEWPLRQGLSWLDG
jgi:hypothetical protein